MKLCAYGEKGMLEDQIRCLKAAARVGNAVGQLELGKHYKRGEGVPKSYSKAAELFAKATTTVDENDHFYEVVIAEAQHHLAGCYHFGHGVEQSSTKAAELWTKAADRNYAPAQYHLGICYQRGMGMGVEQSWPKAAELWSKAADQNDREVLVNLGNCYARGLGVELSQPKSVELWTKAVSLGSNMPYLSLGFAYIHGLGVEQSTSTGVEWLEKAALLLAGGGDEDEGLAKNADAALFKLNNGHNQGVVLAGAALERVRAAGIDIPAALQRFENRMMNAQSWGAWREDCYANRRESAVLLQYLMTSYVHG